MSPLRTLLTGGLVALSLAAPSAAAVAQHASDADRGHDRGHGHVRDEALAPAFTHTTRSTAWTKIESLGLDFDTFHPQSVEVSGDRIYISSVEVIDRAAGIGVGHLFVLDRDGTLLKDIEISDGPRYHPGGIDLHGDVVFVPVAEYKADSSADIYAVNVRTFKVTKLFSYDDHIGGIVYDERRQRFVGNTWGSRTFYEWDRHGRETATWKNPQHWIDYQDCEYVARSKALCSGLAGGVGGLDLIDLADDHRILHQLPVTLTSSSGRLVTQNAVDLDASVGPDGRTTLTFYVAPDDGIGTELTTYQTVIPAS